MWLTTSTGSVSKLLREAGRRWRLVSQAACIRALSRPTQWTTRSGGGGTGLCGSWTEDGTRRADSRVQLARRRADMKERVNRKEEQELARPRLAVAEILYCAQGKCDSSRQRSVCRAGPVSRSDSSLLGMVAFATASCVSGGMAMHSQLDDDAAEDGDAYG
jgi:hypothetical protein